MSSDYPVGLAGPHQDCWQRIFHNFVNSFPLMRWRFVHRPLAATLDRIIVEKIRAVNAILSVLARYQGEALPPPDDLSVFCGKTEELASRFRGIFNEFEHPGAVLRCGGRSVEIPIEVRLFEGIQFDVLEA